MRTLVVILSGVGGQAPLPREGCLTLAHGRPSMAANEKTGRGCRAPRSIAPAAAPACRADTGVPVVKRTAFAAHSHRLSANPSRADVACFVVKWGRPTVVFFSWRWTASTESPTKRRCPVQTCSSPIHLLGKFAPSFFFLNKKWYPIAIYRPSGGSRARRWEGGGHGSVLPLREGIAVIKKLSAACIPGVKARA